MRKILALALATLTSVTFGCAIEVVADNVEGSFTKSLAVEGPAVLEVKARSGSVSVVGVDGDEVEVRGKVRVGWRISDEEAKRRVRAIESNPPVKLRDGVVIVGEFDDPDLLDGVSVSYEITVPERAKVTVESRSGSLTVEDVAGPVKLDSRSGGVHVRGVEQDVAVNVRSGSLTVEDVGGSLVAESSSGSQTFRRIAGGVTTKSSSGSVKIEEIGGEVSVRCSSGSVRVHQAAAAPVTVEATSGSIRVETVHDAGYDFDVETRSGGIDLPDHEVRLTQDDKRHKKGALRGGGPLLALHARSGGVDIR